MEDVSKDVLLSDVCVSTSAAPTYLPPHYFESKKVNGELRTFDLVDGGVAANNPVSTAKYDGKVLELSTLEFSLQNERMFVHDWDSGLQLVRLVLRLF